MSEEGEGEGCGCLLLGLAVLLLYQIKGQLAAIQETLAQIAAAL